MTEQMYSTFSIIATVVIGVLMVISGFVLRPTGLDEKPKKVHTKA
jgi:hypothetical protein